MKRDAVRTLFLDLDGPLLDVAERYHRLHRDLVLRRGGQPLAAAEYWELKRDRTPEEEILARAGLSPGAAAAAAAAHRSRIESRRYLRFDRPWAWTAPALDSLARLATPVLITARRHRDRLLWQLARLGLEERFESVLAGPGDGTPLSKARLLLDSRLTWAPGSVLVGDSEVDIASGRALGLITVALDCGVRNAARLAACNPDLLLGDLRQVAPRLAALGRGRAERR